MGRVHEKFISLLPCVATPTATANLIVSYFVIDLWLKGWNRLPERWILHKMISWIWNWREIDLLVLVSSYFLSLRRLFSPSRSPFIWPFGDRLSLAPFLHSFYDLHPVDRAHTGNYLTWSADLHKVIGGGDIIARCERVERARTKRMFEGKFLLLRFQHTHSTQSQGKV